MIEVFITFFEALQSGFKEYGIEVFLWYRPFLKTWELIYKEIIQGEKPLPKS